MLFGPTSAYAEYRTSYPQVASCYDRFVSLYDKRNLTAFTAH